MGNEGFAAALIRETREELGEDIAELVEEMLQAADGANFALLNEQVNDKGRMIRTFGLKTSWDFNGFLSLVEKGHDVAGFRACTNPQEILPLADEHKKGGVAADQTRMFSDEKLSVERFFEKFYWVENPAGDLEVEQPGYGES